MKVVKLLQTYHRLAEPGVGRHEPAETMEVDDETADQMVAQKIAVIVQEKETAQ